MHMLYVIVKNFVKQFSPTRPDGEIGKNFSWQKIPAIRYDVVQEVV